MVASGQGCQIGAHCFRVAAAAAALVEEDRPAAGARQEAAADPLAVVADQDEGHVLVPLREEVARLQVVGRLQDRHVVLTSDAGLRISLPVVRRMSTY